VKWNHKQAPLLLLNFGDTWDLGALVSHILFSPDSACTGNDMRLLLRTSFRLLDLAISCTLFLRLTCAIPLNPNQKHSSYNYGVDRNTILKRQSPNFYAINGIQSGSGPNGSLPLRLEIRELEQEPTMWTLYILGLDMLQYTNQTEMLSWYQIAGIGHS
jgi:tyrosinase